jgi:hypothetical protein
MGEQVMRRNRTLTGVGNPTNVDSLGVHWGVVTRIGSGILIAIISPFIVLLGVLDDLNYDLQAGLSTILLSWAYEAFYLVL